MQRKFIFIIIILNSSAFQIDKNLSLPIDVRDKNLKEENLRTALSLIVQANFILDEKPLRFFISYDANSSQYIHDVNDVVDGVLSDILIHSYKVIYNGQKVYWNIQHNEIVLLDNLNTFRHFFSKIKYIGNLDLSTTLIFISSLTSLDDASIYLVFKELYNAEMLTVALVIMQENGDIFLLTYFPFTPKACQNFQPVIINQFLADEQRWATDMYFPFKLQDFYGCPIHFCTWELMPYLRLNRNKENNDIEGLEAEVLKFMASSINASIDIKLIDPIDANVEDAEDFIPELLKQKCDLVLGGIPYRPDFDKTRFAQTRFISFSHIYIITNAINFYTKYEKLAFPFDYSVWLALGLTFALSIFLISICEWQRQWTGYRNFIIGPTNTTPQFNLYTVAVGSTLTTRHLPKRNFARFLLTCWMLLTFILRSAYQSGMYQMLRDNKQWNPPQTIQNVFEQKYLISTTPKYQKYLEILPHTKQVRIFNTTILETFTEMVVAKEPIALIVPYEYYGYLHKINLSLWLDLHLVRERLLTKTLTIYSPHHSLIIPLLNKKLSYGHYHGLMSLWNRKNILPLPTALKYEYISENLRNKNSLNYFLTLNELGAIFMILIWLHIFAVVVFLVEWTWHRYGMLLKRWLLGRHATNEHILE